MQDQTVQWAWRLGLDLAVDFDLAWIVQQFLDAPLPGERPPPPQCPPPPSITPSCPHPGLPPAFPVATLSQPEPLQGGCCRMLTGFAGAGAQTAGR